MAKTKSKSKHDLIKKVVLYVILILIAVIMAVPFIWMLSASIKSDREVFQMDPFVLIPKNPKWSNYAKIWTKIPMLTFVKNTVVLTIIVTFLQLFTSSFAAYAFAKLRFKFRNGLFLAYIATIAMPWQVYMVPQFLMMRSFGLNDKLLAMICLQAFSAFGVFMMKQFYEGIPNELCEAARIDGASELYSFHRIVIPILSPAVATMGIMSFIGNWNNYLLPMIIINKNEKMTLPVMMATLKASTDINSNQGAIYLSVAISVIPILLVFAFFSKYIISSVSAGAVKE